MKKSQLEHVLRAASRICGEDEFIVIGSQSLHGKHPDVADNILVSREVDLLTKRNIEKSDFLNVIGIDSPFHEEFGYYADPVDAKTAILPKNWKSRLVHLKLDDNQSKVKAYCLEPHDLIVAKLAAGRDKDQVFIRELLKMGLVIEQTVRLRLKETSVSASKMQSMDRLLTALALQKGSSG